MREIEFRGFDKQRKEWVYGYFVMFGDESFIIEYGKPGIPSQTIEVDPESVGQFIGRGIENGVRIFEGDILKGDFDKGKYEMKWQENSVGDDWGNDNPYIGFELPVNSKKLSIIGNIYENPELLNL